MRGNKEGIYLLGTSAFNMGGDNLFEITQKYKYALLCYCATLIRREVKVSAELHVTRYRYFIGWFQNNLLKIKIKREIVNICTIK
ncbi:MAG: hypothetical protein ACJAYJ_000027 [Saprospiraceae bacterium]|jgi:hypothetical protein